MIKMELLEQWQQTEIWGLGRMIKLKDLLLEIKPLNNREIKALEKKIDAPIKRGGNKNAIIPPNAEVGSVLNAKSYALNAELASATPQGLACLTITHAGPENSLTHSHAASASTILL